LRALQEREISRIGGVKPIKVDVRVVAATNRDLWRAVEEGTFRLDLYYRLNVVPVHLPSLAERAADIPDLAMYFLEKACRENGRRPICSITPNALDTLVNHRWPGNIRELQNAMEYASVMASDDAREIDVDDLPDAFAGTVRTSANHLRVVNG
ncbi:MAG: sigma 54-interacting transcriptional regulator, partial [Armatimonadaceae bacterium]